MSYCETLADSLRFTSAYTWHMPIVKVHFDRLVVDAHLDYRYKDARVLLDLDDSEPTRYWIKQKV